MNLKITFYDNSATVTVENTDDNNAWTFSKADLEQHSGAWFLNQILSRGDSEKL